MRKLLLLLILIFCIALPSSANVGVSMVGASVGGGAAPASPNPDVYYTCEDNAASATIVATNGPNGSILGSTTSNNTADNTTTTSFAGSRATLLNDDTATLDTPLATNYASLSDGDFTIQFAYRADATTGFASNYVRLVTDSAGSNLIHLLSNAGSSTSLWILVGATDCGTFTVDEINDNAWHLFRIVVDTDATNKVVVYQGTTEGNLTAKLTRTSATTSPTFTSDLYIKFGGIGDANKGIQLRNGILDEVKIWYTAVTP